MSCKLADLVDETDLTVDEAYLIDQTIDRVRARKISAEAAARKILTFLLETLPKNALTSDKTFGLNSPDVVRLGIPAIRVLLADAAFCARPDAIPSRLGFREVGLAVHRNFLDPEETVAVQREIESVGPALNLTSENRLSPKFPAAMRAMDRIRKIVYGYYGFFECGTLLDSRTYLQKLEVSPSENDEQREPHRDTFFHALKFWYFPEGTGSESLCYALGSNVLTSDRLSIEQTWTSMVSAGIRGDNRGDREGSFRVRNVYDAMLACPDTAEAGSFHVPEQEVGPNTLVVADVFGIHCRGTPSGTKPRLALHGSLRPNFPFSDTVE